MRKSVWLGLVLALLFGWAVTASAVQIGIHGQLAHKVQYANTLGITEERIANDNLVLNKDKEDINAAWASLQYRLWFDVASDDNNVKGVWAFEVGSAPFGAHGALDIANAGDSKSYQTRLAYADVRLPWFASENRVAIGLQEIDISSWLFKEIATGIVNHGSFDAGTAKVEYQLGWVRTEQTTDTEYKDAWFGTVAFDVEPVKVKAFGVYQTDNSPWYIGAEVSSTPVPGLDVALTGICERGKYKTDVDASAYLVAFNAGYQVNDQFKVSGTFWYASGDDDATDNDMDGYSAIKTDTYGSVIFFEDASFDDGVRASNKPYLAFKDNNEEIYPGFYIFRIRGDYQATPKLSVAGAVNYMSFAKGDDKSIGWEFDGYANYELYKNVNVNLAAGYLISGDGLGDDADNLYRVSVGLTYNF